MLQSQGGSPSTPLLISLAEGSADASLHFLEPAEKHCKRFAVLVRPLQPPPSQPRCWALLLACSGESQVLTRGADLSPGAALGAAPVAGLRMEGQVARTWPDRFVPPQCSQTLQEEAAES